MQDVGNTYPVTMSTSVRQRLSMTEILFPGTFKHNNNNKHHSTKESIIYFFYPSVVGNWLEA